MISPVRRQKIRNDVAERSYTQWILMAALAFAERAYILVVTGVFILDSGKEFLSLPGIFGFLSGLLFLSPVFGIFVFFTHKIVFALLKARQKLPQDISGFRRLAWAVNIFWLPIVFLLTFHAINLFYASYDEFKSIIFVSSSSKG